MGLLDGELADVINSAVDFLMRDVTLIKKDARVYDGATGTFQNNVLQQGPTKITCRGYRRDFNLTELQKGELIGNSTCVVELLQRSFTGKPEMTDRVTLDSVEYIVNRVEQDPAGALWTCYVG